MRAREGAVRAARRAEGWLFGPGSARRLAACRIGLCLLLATRLSRPLYLQLAGQPRVLFRPISFMHLFSAMPSRGVVLTVQVVSVAAALAGGAGVVTRPAIGAAWLGALFLNGMWSSLGMPTHNETLLLLALVPFLFAPSADAWSLSARRRGAATSERSVRYGWPVRTGMVVVAGGYFFSGIYKLLFSGPAWALSGNLRWVMYLISDENRRPIGPALFLAGHPLLAHVAAAASLVTEIGFPLCLWKPKAAWFFVPAVVLLHLGIGLTMHLDYSAWAITTVVLFVPWDAPADRRAARSARLAVEAPGTR